MQSRITGATTLLRRSTLKVLARVQAGANHLLYGYIAYLGDQLFISKADEYGLVSHGAEWGIDRKASVTATGTCTATGTDGTVIPAGTELTSADGQVYTVDSEVTVASSTATLSLTAEVAGLDGNQDASTVLTFVSPIVGVDDTATADSTDGIESGSDEEEVEEWRIRLLERKRQPPHGGAAHDYENWALEVAGVTRAWSFPLYFGIGTVGLAFVRDDDASVIPSSAEMETVYDYVISHEDSVTGKTIGIPVTAEPGFFLVGYNDSQTFSTVAIDMTIGIYPNTSTVQTSINSKIDDVLRELGGPGETVYISDVYYILGGAAGIERLRITLPATDITATQQQVHIRGAIEYEDY